MTAADDSGVDAPGREGSGPGAVVIVGAGPAGLTAAYELAKRGATSTVFETDTVVRAHRKAARREATLATGIRRSASFLEDLWRSRSDVTPTN
jgi:glycine/D-amino acid oxidase-like deaminating enzyme